MPPVGGQSASACQISSKSVKQLRIYGDLTVLKMAAVCHLFFQNGGRPRSHSDGHLVVFSVVQNLVGVDAVVLIIM